jgi:hypothetical protein
MIDFVASPQCSIELYPLEGGTYSIQGGQILSLQTTKQIRDDAGNFEFILAPGGPAGTNSLPTWFDIITPMSLVIIGLRRGNYTNIVMLGVVSSITESETWTFGSPVQRAVVVAGLDFGKFFMMANWLAITFLGGFAVPAAASITGVSPEVGLSSLGPGLLKGTPDQVATAWFTNIMSKVMNKTYVNYQGKQITFPTFMGYWFEAFDNKIPTMDYYLATTDVWINKFKEILLFPWWEVFVTTAPPNTYPNATGGRQFSLKAFGPNVTAAAYVIGRINPFPYVPATISGATVSFGTVNLSKWNALPLFMQDSSYISSNISISDSLVRNVYVLNPTLLQSMFGQVSNGFLAPFTFQYSAAFDAASILRYGFRPELQNIRWLSDPQGDWAQSGSIDVAQLVAALLSRLTSYYEPMPLMAMDVATFPLRPDILIGCKFRFSPGKNEPTWDFYIEGVSHTFTFGGQSSTSLRLTRGLPTSVYAGQGGILSQMLIGNAERINGSYQVGLPAGSVGGLQAIKPGNEGTLAALTGADQAWRTPQQK